jgi:hypothetical protein
VLSYLCTGHSLAENYRPHLECNTAVISYMKLAELYYGTLKNYWGVPRRADLMTHVAREYVLFPFNRALCFQLARVRDRSRRAGHCIKVAAPGIAATVMLHRIPLVE